MIASFQLGDVVRLRSGGPEMTINEIADYAEDGNLSASCAWFQNGDDLVSQVFPLVALEKIKEGKSTIHL